MDVFTAANSGTGGIAFTDTKTLLTVTGIANTAAGGAVTVSTAGDLTISGAVSGLGVTTLTAGTAGGGDGQRLRAKCPAARSRR